MEQLFENLKSHGYKKIINLLKENMLRKRHSGYIYSCFVKDLHILYGFDFLNKCYWATKDSYTNKTHEAFASDGTYLIRKF